MIYRVVFFISAAVVPVVISYWLKRRYRVKFQQLFHKTRHLDNNYYHCMFWNIDNHECREHMINSTECGTACSTTYLNTLLKFFSSAKQSIDLCMYLLTLRQVMEELIKARNRGVTVRIITDNVTSKMGPSRMNSLKEHYGFDVRTPPYSEAYMHHKFCVIDARDATLQKMFMGSLNLTLQGFTSNFEFVVITNSPQMVLHYSNEFELLWNYLQN